MCGLGLVSKGWTPQYHLPVVEIGADRSGFDAPPGNWEIARFPCKSGIRCFSTRLQPRPRWVLNPAVSPRAVLHTHARPLCIFQFELGNHATMHFVRAICQTQNPSIGKQCRQRKSSPEPPTAMDLDGLIGDALQHRGCHDFNRGNIGQCAKHTQTITFDRRLAM